MCEICGSHRRDAEAYYLLECVTCSLVYISCFNGTSQAAVYYKKKIRYKNTNLAINLTKYRLNAYYIVTWRESEHIKAYISHFNFVSSSFQEVIINITNTIFSLLSFFRKKNKSRLMTSPCLLCLLIPPPHQLLNSWTDLYIMAPEPISAGLYVHPPSFPGNGSVKTLPRQLIHMQQ
jgi:hypothetical protein